MDTISKLSRSENMRRITGGNTAPEMKVRSLVFRFGYRYRIHDSKLPGRPDMVFPGRNKVIFVNGCFWHQHKSGKCGIVRMPKSNTSYWIAKMTRNIDRDKRNLRKIRQLGWRSLTIWECQVSKADWLAVKIRQFEMIKDAQNPVIGRL